MKAKQEALSSKFILKIGISLLITVVTIGVVYILLTIFFVKKFYSETTQKLNCNVANHLIDEKFKEASPFLKDGAVNKVLFDGIMHDMMAVNRAIDVYLLSETGKILYSVVLDHSNPQKQLEKVNLNPIKQFIKNKKKYVLGDDPRESGSKKIFSAGYFTKGGHSGYVYIILTSKKYQEVCESLLEDYFLKFSIRSTIVTMIFAISIGWISIWALTKNLRTIIYYVNRFKEGNLEARIPNAYKSDLSILAVTFNNMAQTISENIREIQSINKFRKQLIANVSHDLRTPITSIRGYIETLQMKNDILEYDDNREFMKIIENGANYLSSLVNHLFEYSRLETKELKLSKEVFFISDLVYDMASRYKLLIERKNINLSVIVKNDLSPVFADSALIERAIQNILDNAIKFTEKGGRVTIYLSCKLNNVVVKIKDNGMGIRKEDQEIIFNRNMQITNDYKEKGIGLGLAIAKKIIELHQSSIKVRSLTDRGSTFEFHLPCHKK